MVARYVSLFFSLFLLSQPPVDALCFLHRTPIFLAPIYICHEYRLMILPLVEEKERASLCCEKNRSRQRERVGEIASCDRNRATLSCEPARYTTALVTLANNGAMLRRTPAARPTTATISFFHTAPENGWRRFPSAIIIKTALFELRRYTSLTAALH